MLEVSALRKSFVDGDRRIDVLADIELRLGAGEFVALLGRSGSGKSTLLNCIAGLEPADAGSIRIDGQEMTGLDEIRRTLLRRDRIGIIFQFFELLPTLDVQENVALPLLLAGRPRAEANRRVAELLERLQLGARARELPEHLSGGERQRVATARALVHSPALLLADEPTGNLDSANADRSLHLLEEVRGEFGVAILMVTHSRYAASVADRRLQLADGRVREATDADA